LAARADLLERGVDLAKHLRDLAAGVLRWIFGDFNPAGDAGVDDDVGPALGGSVANDVRHGADCLWT
jgi:hypothetical protein